MFYILQIFPNESFVNVSWIFSNVLFPSNISIWELCECFQMRALWMFLEMFYFLQIFPNESLGQFTMKCTSQRFEFLIERHFLQLEATWWWWQTYVLGKPSDFLHFLVAWVLCIAWVALICSCIHQVKVFMVKYCVTLAPAGANKMSQKLNVVNFFKLHSIGLADCREGSHCSLSP